MKRTLAVGVLAIVLFGMLLRRVIPVRAAGDSMAPAVKDGDVLAMRRLRSGEPRRGQIVIARTPEREIIKRVVAVPGERGLADGEYWLEGDHLDRSTDSRSLGPMQREQIAGVVVACYVPLHRARIFVGGRAFPSAARRAGGTRGARG